MSKLSTRTSSVRNYEGIPVVVPNRTDEVNTGSNHWYISYNNHCISDYGCDTTALVIGQMEYFLILNGDHRAEFIELISTPFEKRKCKTNLKLCLDYIRKNKDKLNKFSDTLI